MTRMPDPTARADSMRLFMAFPSPLALVSTEGATRLVNHAFAARFGNASVVPASLVEAARRGGGECQIRLRSPELADPAEVNAHAIPMPDHFLLRLGWEHGSKEQLELDEMRSRLFDLERRVATDHLTGAWNRAHFDRVITAELSRCVAGEEPVSLVLLDIDHFKRVNDTFGHSTGDSVLRELVQVVQSNIRASDLLFRWGGEEFVVLAASAGHRGAARLAENLRRAIAAHPFSGVGALTASFGVAEHAGREGATSWFGRLDKALYDAKESGRNRVVTDHRGSSDAWAMESGGTSLHLQWREGYECGDPVIDSEHRELFALANQAIDAAWCAESDPARLRAALTSLLAHIGRHFANEEAILARLDYCDLAKHKRAHEGLLQRADHLLAAANASEASLGAVVEFMAQHLVARHLLTVDRAFFPLFDKPVTSPT